jgi:hypothetical protein
MTTTNPAWAAQSETIIDLAAALVDAQKHLPSITKGRTANVGQYAYRYADLADVISSVRQVLQVSGLVITQTAETNDHEVIVWTTLLHRSGQYLTTQPTRLPVGKTAQNTGSALTYARRYAILAMLGIATEDDDDGASAAPRDERSTRATLGSRARQPETIETKQSPAARSDDETWIREQLAVLDPENAKIIRDGFRAEFGQSLSEMPVPGHQAARAFVAECIETIR